MALAKITQVTGRGVYVAGNDIDTDRIIPARFMKCVSFDGLGEFLFHDARKDAAAAGRPHPLDDPRRAGATILLSGANFGCGSSREHAPQALQKHGFKAVVAENFAEIFFGNSTTLGMPCVSAKREDIAKIAAAIEKDAKLEVIIDLAKQQIRFGADSVPLTVRESARDALVNGRWDAIGELLEGKDATLALAKTLPYMAAA
jgi:3-isopropylmalate/(R)-2-methylmalate dehydratase small subunit